MRHTLLDLLSSIFLGWGIVLLGSPVFLYWFIHGNFDRYVWIIMGPYPFSHFGGGPFQMAMFSLLFLCGLIFVAVALLLRHLQR